MGKQSSRRRNARRPTPARMVGSDTTPRREVDLAEEYRYVLDDLKRVGILAAVLVGALVGLSFVLPLLLP